MAKEGGISDFWRHQARLNQDVQAGAISSLINPAKELPLPLAAQALIGNDIRYYSLADHQHQHGNMAGGSQHTLGSQTQAGFVPAFGATVETQFLSAVGGQLTWVPTTGTIVGPGTTVVGNLVAWGDTVGTDIADSGIPAASILNASQHAALRQLIHFINDGPAEGFASGSQR